VCGALIGLSLPNRKVTGAAETFRIPNTLVAKPAPKARPPWSAPLRVTVVSFEDFELDFAWIRFLAIGHPPFCFLRLALPSLLLSAEEDTGHSTKFHLEYE
jgi:hypothetical protein